MAIGVKLMCRGRWLTDCEHLEDKNQALADAERRFAWEASLEVHRVSIEAFLIIFPTVG
jgi:hypothetical protein